MISLQSKLVPALMVLALAGNFACSKDDGDDSTAAQKPSASESSPSAQDAGANSQASQGSLSLAASVVADSRFSTLKVALEKADLVSVLEQGEYTVFAPTNEAFARIPADTLNALLADKEALTRVLLYHVVPGKLTADKVLAQPELKTAQELPVKISSNEQGAFVNDARIIETDIIASNGVIHAIDTVLMPPSKSMLVNKSNLVDLVANNPDFSTLKQALIAAGLIETLQSGEFTVFAPTNEAFAKLGQKTLDAVLADKALLTSILLYHVVPGSVKAKQVLTSKSLKTAAGGSLTPSVKKGAAYINDAKILATDVTASNGVVHVIDTVLLPPSH